MTQIPIFNISNSDESNNLSKLISDVAFPSSKLQQTVFSIISEVRQNGDKALINFSKKFDKAITSNLSVDKNEVNLSEKELDVTEKTAIKEALNRVLEFSKRQIRKDWKMRNLDGATVGEKFDPIPRVGVYIPGGKAPLISTVIMTCGLALAAGVKEIVAISPPTFNNSIHPAILYALKLCKVTEIYRVGGAHGVAGLAYGTETIRPVSKIFGPGNSFVVEAKRQLFGKVAIDLLPGPSEIIVLADKDANPRIVTADLLAQLEHGYGTRAVLATNSKQLITKVTVEIEKITKEYPDSLKYFDDSAKNKNLFFAYSKSIYKLCDFIDDFAPEHALIYLSKLVDEEKAFKKITNAGAIFLGKNSPVAIGDYYAGPSHVLPTNQSAKGFPGLCADQFQTRTSFVKYSKKSLEKASKNACILANKEGLKFHANSITSRF